ncbi:ankyrin repeat-containing domain protein [Podospora appendiculata]|uniref:Ankyrin repeat-containing domain protein n=1 Tax=Podospora appendiculata TaxID=314037 RepID=A0AAE1CBF4_9PEZI|nr:ankyrin repeat-containing domain protein [Podospora appendiculata]
MEVLGVIIGVTGITIRTSSKIWSLCSAWRDAPKDLHRLCNDLTRAQRFFCETQHGISAIFPEATATTAKAHRWAAASREDLQVLLAQGEAVLKHIEDLADRLQRGDDWDMKMFDLSKRRRAIWLRNAHKVARLRRELSEIISNICRLLITQNVIVSAELHTSIERSRDQIMSYVDNRLENAVGRLSAHTDRLVEKSTELAVSRLGGALELSQRTVMSHLDCDAKSLQLDGVNSTRLREPGTKNGSTFQSSRIFVEPGAGHRDPDTGIGTTWASFVRHSIRFARRVSPCDKNCHCRCHFASSYRGWRMNALRSILGSMILTYSGTSTQTCTDATCRNNQSCRPSTEISILYHFPDWLVRVAVSVFFSSNMNGNPQMNIRLLNRVRPDTVSIQTSIFGYIRRRDIEGVRRLLEQRLASVYDIRGDNHQSPLTYALVTGNSEMAKLLIQAGADPYQEMSYQDTPVKVAFQLYVTGDAAGNQLSQVLPLSEYPDQEAYSALQKIVLEFLPIDLAEALQKPQYVADVNRRSADGMYPLHLAAMSGRLKAARLLIRAGADVDSKEKKGRTPLHWACIHNHFEVARLLIQAGADIHAGNANKRTPLVSAVLNPRIVSLLIRHGADVNKSDFQDCQPLAIAAHNGALEAVRLLIDSGADINHRDWEGDTALCEAGADFRNVNDHGWGVLHQLATGGDVELMRMFTAFGMTGVSSAAKDVAGRTPLELFNRRMNPTPELRRAFDELLDSVERADEMDCSDDDGDEFVDARETWD